MLELSPMVRYWWLVALRGLCAVLFGVMALFWPGITLATLVLLFGAFALVSGVFSLITAIRRPERWWSMALEGAAGIGAGLLALFLPRITALSVVYLMAAWAVVIGALEIVAAVRLRKRIDGEFLLALSGIASVAVGIFMALWPGAGALALVWMIGAYAMVFGVLNIVLGFRLRDENPAVAMHGHHVPA